MGSLNSPIERHSGMRHKSRAVAGSRRVPAGQETLISEQAAPTYLRATASPSHLTSVSATPSAKSPVHAAAIDAAGVAWARQS